MNKISWEVDTGWLLLFCTAEPTLSKSWAGVYIGTFKADTYMLARFKAGEFTRNFSKEKTLTQLPLKWVFMILQYFTCLLKMFHNMLGELNVCTRTLTI